MQTWLEANLEAVEVGKWRMRKTEKSCREALVVVERKDGKKSVKAALYLCVEDRSGCASCDVQCLR